MAPICRRLVTAPNVTMRRERRLPLSGEILVRTGEAVNPETVVGYNSAEECLHILRLDVDESRVLAKLLRNVGDTVKRGEPVAYYMYFFGLGYREYVSPVNGTISSFDRSSGTMVIREHARPVTAGMYGVVEEVIEGHSVIVSARGALVEGTAGWGELAHGQLLVLADSPEQDLDAQRIGPHCRGKIVVAGALADSRALLAAYRHGARAVVAGGINKAEGDEFERFVADMSYEEYAARFYSSGHEIDVDNHGGLDRVTMTVLATDGFGRTPMRAEAFALLRAGEGREAYVDGGTGGPEGRLPEVAVTGPHPAQAGTPAAPAANEVCAAARCRMPCGLWGGLAEGMRVRVVSGPSRGRAGWIAAWGSDIVLETGHVTTGARLRLADGTEVDVPVANIEIVETGPAAG